VGEIVLRTPFRSLGYLANPEESRLRFRPNPFSDDPEDLLYFTGDRGRYRLDGTLEILGRLDEQVKIRGVRIEPAEIRAALGRHPAVWESAVLLREHRLVAYLVLQAGAVLDPETLRRHLRHELPEAMIPSIFVVLDALPLTPNGKVDRRALERIAPEERVEAGVVAPRTPDEELVAGIFADVLGLERVGVEESFFELGGHSLAATQVMARVFSIFGVELPLRALFEAPTVAAFARTLSNRGPRIEAFLPSPARGRGAGGEGIPLSLAQERLWFLDRLMPDSGLYTLFTPLELEGPLDPGAFARALTGVVHRHESLRTTLPSIEERPVQVIAGPAPVPLPVVDLRALPEAMRRREARALVTAASRWKFDLAAGPLLRCLLVRREDEHSTILLGVHHTVCDLWSIGLLVHEVAALYREEVEGVPARLPELPIQYANYAVWQRQWLTGATIEREVAWWRERLAGVPAVVELPTDRPRPVVQGTRGAQQSVMWPASFTAALGKLGRREGSTLFMVLLAGLDALLHRYGRQERIAVGTPIAHRGQVELEGLIGNFAETLVIPVELRADLSFRDLLARVRESALGAYAHQDLPFELLVEALNPRRDLSHNPLFQVLLALHNLPQRETVGAGLTLRWLPTERETARFDLALDLTETPDGLQGTLEYATDLFDAPTIDRLLGHLQGVLAGALAEPERRVGELPLLGEVERHQLLVEWNDEASPGLENDSLHKRFEAWARRAPESLAVICGEERLTYGDLDRRAEELAYRLRSLGVGPEVPVGICLERSAGLIEAILGVLKAGGAYVPLDPTYPSARLAAILDQTEVPVVVTRSSLVSLLPETSAVPVHLDEPWEHAPWDRRRPAGTSDNLAYLIFTSGSTGQPKGVAIPHAGAVHLVDRARERVGFGPGDVWTLVHSFGFDFSVWEIWGALSQGGTLVVVPLEVAQSPEQLAALIRRERVTVLNQTPSAIRALAEVVEPGDFPSLRRVICGGEAFPRDLADELLTWGIPIWAFYGPTESTVWAAAGQVTSESEGSGAVPLGRPLADHRLHVLDEGLQPVPAGAPGELHIAGPGLARGYFGDPALTAQSFVPDPFGAPGARLYRTGDLVRRLPTGTLDFLGRIDHQVKLRGFRIELGEIEAVLARHPAVQETAVVLRDDLPGGPGLASYVVGNGGEDPLRAWLHERLPAYMVPASFTFLESMPRTANGKLDRKTLAALPPERSERMELGNPSEADAPRTPAEELVAALFAEALDLPRVGVDANFFELGGHSLLATQIVSRIRAVFGVELPLRTVFEAPTVAALTRRIERKLAGTDADGRETLPPIPLLAPDERQEQSLSFAQERVWRFEQSQPGTALYNVPLALCLRGDLDRTTLTAALAEAVRRHETLRASGEVRFPVVDLESLHAALREEEAERLSLEEAQRPFDLPTGFRATLIALAPREHLLVLVLHQLFGDGRSMRLLLNELGALYVAFRAGRPSPLPELPIQYADFAAWQRRHLTGERLASGLAWWRAYLDGMPRALDLPTDRPHPAVRSVRGAVHDFAIEGETFRAVASLARRRGATPFMVLLAAFAAVLQRFTGQDDLAVGTPIAGRTRPETELLIGLFARTLVLRVDLGKNPSFLELLGRVRESTLAAHAHQDVPFERLIEDLAPHDPSRPPLVQALFSLRPATAPLELPGFHLTTYDLPTGTTRFELICTLAETAHGLAGTLKYSRDLFEPPTIERLIEGFGQLLAEALADPEKPVTELAEMEPAVV